MGSGDFGDEEGREGTRGFDQFGWREGRGSLASSSEMAVKSLSAAYSEVHISVWKMSRVSHILSPSGRAVGGLFTQPLLSTDALSEYKVFVCDLQSRPS